MKITYLFHSGFLVELAEASLLFDWWKGALPPLRNVPLYCFASHHHPDHFNPRIFTLGGGRKVHYILGSDIRLKQRDGFRWGLTRETAARCRCLRGGESASFPPLTVTALRSTDCGVAFLVRCGGRTIYHAGDLNLWYWEKAGKAENGTMAANFRLFTKPLENLRLDAAFLPLDPRLGNHAPDGVLSLLQRADIRRVFPMHQWGDGSPTRRFLQEHPEFRDRMIPADTPGQSWCFPD